MEPQLGNLEDRNHTAEPSVMHSWREDTECAIGQQVDNILVTDGSGSAPSSGTDTPTTLIADQPGVPDRKTGGTQAIAVAALDSQMLLPAPGTVANKNPYGLKPEYKTALRDFFVCLSQIYFLC